jgi:cyclopropane fatty-acyl-phospholipid synthase-like methyltransferase
VSRIRVLLFKWLFEQSRCGPSLSSDLLRIDKVIGKIHDGDDDGWCDDRQRRACESAIAVTKAETETILRFTDRCRISCTPAWLGAETEALGTDYGSTGYTTRSQADDLADHLRLLPGDLLADIGAGSGWPGLHLAAVTGCRVVGTDLTVESLQRARTRAEREGLAARAVFVAASGRRLPLRSGSFDAAVHTDVLCCLGPKLAVLRACRQLLRPGGRLAFTTIHISEGLEPPEHRRAVRAGPPHVESRRPYAELVAQAGFVDVVDIDVTADYARTQQAWYEAIESRGCELRKVVLDKEFELAQADRRLTTSAIQEGLLRRRMITASKPADA